MTFLNPLGTLAAAAALSEGARKEKEGNERARGRATLDRNDARQRRSPGELRGRSETRAYLDLVQDDEGPADARHRAVLCVGWVEGGGEVRRARAWRSDVEARFLEWHRGDRSRAIARGAWARRGTHRAAGPATGPWSPPPPAAAPWRSRPRGPSRIDARTACRAFGSARARETTCPFAFARSLCLSDTRGRDYAAGTLQSLSPPVALSARVGSHPDTRGPRASV